MQTKPNKIPRSSHFHLEQINEGIYAAIAIGGGGAFSNSGIVNLGERTIIFDTLETPIAAEDLRVANESLTGNPITWVINSHAHSDLGDIGFFKQLPYMPDCDHEVWVEILKKLEESNLEIFIPGYGPVGTKEDLKLLERYIILLRKWVGEFDRNGKPIEDLLQMELPEPYKTWSAGSSRHEANCQFMFDYQGRIK
jgi:glyoxylase-like metal-dependent hydrolase (beta-lactamase superfamily II)